MRAETVVYKTAGDLAIEADIYRPASEQNCPAIVYIHGGALMMGNRDWLPSVQRDWFVEDGFAVVSIDYRLAPETRLGAIATDVEDAFAWVRGDGARRFRFDPDRIGVVGASAGGYLTLLAGQRVRPRPRALVSFYGYGDLIGEWYSRPDPYYCLRPFVSEADAFAGVGTIPISGVQGEANDGRGRFYLYCRQQGLWPQLAGGHDPDREPEAFKQYCPVQHVSAEYPPTLLLHGDRDTDVPYEQSVMMAAALDRSGVEHELITIAGGRHGFDQDLDNPFVVAAFEKVRGFLRRHV